MKNQLTAQLFYIAFGFLLGSVMFSRILPRVFLKKDICALSKDKNPGASNVFVHCGIPMGLLCLALDMAKGFVPVFLASRTTDVQMLLFAGVMVAPVLGHALAVFNDFHGGKCIATIFGVLIALLPLTPAGWLLAGLYILFSGIIRVKPNRKCSLLTFTLFGAIAGVMLTRHGKFSIAGGCVVMALLAILKHLVPEAEPLPEEKKAD